MKKRFIILALSVCAAVLAAFAFAPASASVSASAKTEEPDAVKARFLNMLNRNFCYGADFEDADTLTQNSMLAILDRRENSDSQYLPQAAVIGFVSDMYGIEIAEITEDESVHKDGYVYINPRGYTAYRHEITEISENEDGSFTVYSSVTVSPHDNDEFVTEAETLIVPNGNSAFGYNIIYSELKCMADGI
ncbi:MAG: hypothetical protein IKZ59_04930 [Clostridia bacterium]|nr:hypothetical protein [Clostridia bacterium]